MTTEEQRALERMREAHANALDLEGRLLTLSAIRFRLDARPPAYLEARLDATLATGGRLHDLFSPHERHVFD